MFKELKLKNLADYDDYDDLYVQNDTLLLADVFENFSNKYFEIYELDPSHFQSSPVIGWQAYLKKDRSRIRIINKY